MESRQKLPARVFTHPREYEYQATYRAYLFGPFRFFCQEQAVGDLMQRRNKARMILKWFLLNPGKLGSADEFIDLFWPEIPLDKALGNFHVTMHYLRRMLEPDLSARQESTFVHRKPNNFYWFQMDENWWIDTSDLEMLLERAREYDLSGDYRRAAYYYRKAASYCSQGFLPEDEPEDWLLPYRKRYRHTYSQVLLRLIQIYTQWNELEDVLEYAYQSIVSDPYSEIAIRAIVDAHLQQGNIVTAQRRLDTFWSALHSDLGLHPNKEFYTLRERIRAANN
ncbi:MAG TPA: BTAD domain-containing putative transcriptional regulator [Ktedonobacteraceae bacterium]|nr:BTAD domain-containing putative transcriptional regulator [Ktedonobacteraceae bacterium]